MKYSGNTYVIACNTCGHPAHYEGIASSNTFGMSSWTDGFNFYPMSDNSSSLFKCYSCSNIYWLSDLKKVGYLSTHDFVEDHNEVPDEIWKKSTPISEPNDKELCEALNNGLFSGTSKEKEARMISWWKSNDKYRWISDSENGGEDLFHLERLKNMKNLSDLLDMQNDKDIIMLAELLREAKEFKEAVNVLTNSQTSNESFQEIYSRLNQLCLDQDFTVRKL